MNRLKAIYLVLGIVASVPMLAAAQQSNGFLNNYQLSDISSDATGYHPSAGDLALQFGGGALIGAAGGAIGGLASVAIFAPGGDNSSAGFAGLGALILGGFAGYTLGTSLGVYIVANSPTHNASFGDIILGNVLGLTASAGIIALINPTDNKAVGAISFVLPIIGGMIANSMSIEKRSGSSALLNISNDETILAAPAVQMQQVGNFSHYGIKDNVPAIKLLNISL
ncbi:MAG: hypothetical protein U5J63_01525 [Fodinibius sp.]|nr:hypothetical protein [Fodinibius sp.]